MAWSAPVLQMHGNYRLLLPVDGNADWLWIRIALALRRRGPALLAGPVVAHRFPHQCADRRGVLPPAHGDDIHLAPEFRIDDGPRNNPRMVDAEFREKA